MRGFMNNKGEISYTTKDEEINQFLKVFSGVNNACFGITKEALSELSFGVLIKLNNHINESICLLLKGLTLEQIKALSESGEWPKGLDYLLQNRIGAINLVNKHGVTWEDIVELGIKNENALFYILEKSAGIDGIVKRGVSAKELLTMACVKKYDDLFLTYDLISSMLGSPDKEWGGNVKRMLGKAFGEERAEAICKAPALSNEEEEKRPEDVSTLWQNRAAAAPSSSAASRVRDNHRNNAGSNALIQR